MTTNYRRAEIKRIREEGKQAAKDGVHWANVPRNYVNNMNEYQWSIGYDAYVCETFKENNYDIT